MRLLSLLLRHCSACVFRVSSLSLSQFKTSLEANYIIILLRLSCTFYYVYDALFCRRIIYLKNGANILDEDWLEFYLLWCYPFKVGGEP